MIRNEQVRVNGEIVIKPAFELRSGDTIQLSSIEEENDRADYEAVELDILHETEDYMVINKSPGIVVHPSPGHESGTLAQTVIEYVPELAGVGDTGREGLVHRLDKDTSGLIIFAKNETTLKLLQQQFKSREIEKTYLALVDGSPPSDKGRVEAPIGRDPEHRQRFAIQDSGRQAVSEFRTRESFKHHSLLEVHPITGRTHQVRIHLQFLECPVVGDKVYGKRNPSLEVERQMLHAWKMKLPGGEEFEAPIPALRTLCDWLPANRSAAL
jgi:23S rRNA pseudouridine1911/1915/1917 synthase